MGKVKGKRRGWVDNAPGLKVGVATQQAFDVSSTHAPREIKKRHIAIDYRMRVYVYVYVCVCVRVCMPLCRIQVRQKPLLGLSSKATIKSCSPVPRPSHGAGTRIRHGPMAGNMQADGSALLPYGMPPTNTERLSSNVDFPSALSTRRCRSLYVTPLLRNRTP